MRKTAVAATLLFVSMVFVACGYNGGAVYLQDVSYVTTYEGVLEEISAEEITSENMSLQAGELRSNRFISPRRQLLVDDFDYMIEVLLNNFPYFGIAERRLGVNVEELIAETREAIVGTRYSLTTNYNFWWVLDHYLFARVGYVGHLFIQAPEMIHLTLANVYRGPVGYDGEFLYMGNREFTYWGMLFRDIVRSEAARQFYGYIEIDLNNYEEGMIEPDNVTVDIVADGIGYISVARFWHYNIEHDRQIIFDFMEEITDFDHLIIDLRGNPGGFTRYFIMNFMMPNLPYGEELIIPMHTMFMAGDYNIPWIEANSDDTYLLFGERTERIPVQEFIDAGDFPYMNPYDLEILDYVSPYYITIRGTGEILFPGRIWVLVDGGSASAVEYASLYIQATGFATIVGEPTRGITGGAMSGFFVLPNTGLIVRHDIGYFFDSYGRAIDEFGVAPDIINFEGMDALETVLAIIEADN